MDIAEISIRKAHTVAECSVYIVGHFYLVIYMGVQCNNG